LLQVSRSSLSKKVCFALLVLLVPWQMRYRYELEVMPSDAEVVLSGIFQEMVALGLPCVTWLGWRTKPLFFGLEAVVASCAADESVDTTSIQESLEGLESIQSVKVVSAVEYVGDPLEMCRRLFFVTDNIQELAPGCVSAAHLRHLFDHGYTVVDSFIAPSEVEEVAALVGASLSTFPNLPDDIRWRLPEPRRARADVATWLTPSERPATDAVFASRILPAFDSLLADLSTCMQLQGKQEHQLAWYPASSTGYSRHTDAEANSDPSSEQRKVSAVLYCNPSWERAHGGTLRLWLAESDGGSTVDVEPTGGRLALFLSGCMPHAVQPSYHERCAVTCWFW